MKKVKLGKSDLEISPIVFGAWAIGGWMWGGTDDELALDAMKAGIDLGVTSIDTAPVYGLGHSEKVIGKLIKEVGRDKVQILTKYGWNWKIKSGEPLLKGSEPGGEVKHIYSYAGKDGVIQEVEDSLKRLGTDYIDLYQIHRPDPLTPIEETMEAVEELIKQGKVLASGVSNHTVELMKRADTVVPVASSQSPYSMVYRKIEKDIIPHSKENNIGILVYSPLQRGLLTGKITSDYKFREGDHRGNTRFFKEPNRTRINVFLDRIKPIAERYEVTLGQLAIRWTLQRPGITAALVGARDRDQMTQNAGAIDFQLSDNDMTMIQAELERLVLEN